ncbi:transferase 1, rSAM/selenodomain-associated/transferase 2, rSAM/selenodomain-associated [Lacrimispora sphenoides]|jgi:rSAM/selenodomain-associated transferase 2/rSAM/selenodomain-associated transferase 1|uniref:TIGR04283 family arsenosugar biosynthesis glycosyltransferase n=1 Tax=Lacrimispora sphenoides TaxID=29370 RepID=UPI0008CCBFE0|nr:TIGR04283 family arsenosugar biosynthesis glycosyltransferase [Lacrimispora sphenoides]SEU22753.1 transferase 1, rSAM/selenodomain-associated/transferase 2, rSAM/selenodomain-associated [Lacrimispora sphenoides]
MRRAIIIFTRVPIPGSTKTRMMPQLSPRQCAKLHICFLKDIKKECEKCKASIFVCYTPDEDKQKRDLKEVMGKQRGYFPQRGEHLGERMYRAFEEVFAMGYEECILIGTDVPELRSDDLKRAFEVLKARDVVFGKTYDGGYYLVGMKKARREVFGLDRYGHGAVLKETIKALSQAGITVGYTKMLWDMDTPSDLKQYRKRMRVKKELKQTETGRYAAGITPVSIIIPIYNEEKRIVMFQEQLKELQGKCEILFVDGGSTDRTLELIDPGYTVLHSEKGRGRQMNAGAKVSCGDILFFLHCDSELPPKPLAEIRRVMRDHQAGCFGIAFHSHNFFMFTCRVISNHRVKDRKVMFGDQGIFVDRELFFEAGMFPEIPIMEDYQFSLILKKKRVKLGIAGRRIYTSDRRFPKGTVPKLRLMWKMNRLRKMYRDGVSIEKISDMYRDIR